MRILLHGLQVSGPSFLCPHQCLSPTYSNSMESTTALSDSETLTLLLGAFASTVSKTRSPGTLGMLQAYCRRLLRLCLTYAPKPYPHWRTRCSTPHNHNFSCEISLLQKPVQMVPTLPGHLSCKHARHRSIARLCLTAWPCSHMAAASSSLSS